MTENLQYRLYNASIPPPDNAWPDIIEQLDIEAQQKLSLKLQQATLDPPPGVWENIAGALTEASRSKVVPMGRRWNRLAVAAVAAGLIVLAGLSYFMSVQSGTEQTAAGKKQQVNPANNNNNATRNDAAGNASVEKAGEEDRFAGRNDRAPVPIASRSVAPVRYARVKNAGLNEGNADNTMSVDEAIDQPVSLQPGAHIGPKAYLTVAAPNGQPARISAKFTDAMSYMLTDEPAQSMDMALKSISWKKRFSNWSNKLVSSSAFIPAATNFFDIVELEELLKEQ